MCHGSLIYTSCEYSSQAQNPTHHISVGICHPNLYVTFYYILFFLQIYFYQICSCRHKMLLMKPGMCRYQWNIPNIIADGKLMHEKMFYRSAEYCSICQEIYSEATEHIIQMHWDLIYKKLGVNQVHRDDCFVGNILNFILHHFPFIVVHIAHIHGFWKEKPSITN